MKPRTRSFYDTAIIYLFMLGKESLLPVEIVECIPFSTKATWRSYLPEKFIGYTQRAILDEGIRRAELHHKYKHIKKVMAAVEAIYIALSDVLDVVKLPLYQVKQYKEKVLDMIQQYRTVIPLDRLLYFFRISRSCYQSWLLEVKVKCSASYFELCVRKYGSQLLKPQVELIQDALSLEKYKHWSVASIAYYFQRMGWVHASVTTWYKYRSFRVQHYKNVEKEMPDSEKRIFVQLFHQIDVEFTAESRWQGFQNKIRSKTILSHRIFFQNPFSLIFLKSFRVQQYKNVEKEMPKSEKRIFV